jgi:uncharacterized SAM-binding protein YcdF (DUF218 family)
MIYIHKTLPYLLYPTTIVLALLIFGIFLKKRTLSFTGLVVLILTSNPLISNQLLKYLEHGQLKKVPEIIDQADAIVVLSGMLTPIQTLNGINFEWGDPDRFFSGLELMKSRKAKYIIFTAGKLPWQQINQSEGDVLAKYATDWGIESKSILITSTVQNTEEEAIAVKNLLTENHGEKIILVTSAFHMPRAKIMFENQGIEVQPFPVDFKSEASDITIMDFLPSAYAMKNFEFAIRELIGRAYYQIKGR